MEKSLKKTSKLFSKNSGIELSSNDNSKQKIAAKRRAALGLMGGGVVAIWQKPLINAVVLPAHAQTSVTATYFQPLEPYTFSSPALSSSNKKADRSSKTLLDWLIPSAHAQVTFGPEAGLFISSVTTGTGIGENFEVSLLVGFQDNGYSLYEGRLNFADGWSGTLNAASDTCPGDPSSVDAAMQIVASNEVTISIPAIRGVFTVEAGTGSLPAPGCVTVDRDKL